jgi:hypothetical protein
MSTQVIFGVAESIYQIPVWPFLQRVDPPALTELVITYIHKSDRGKFPLHVPAIL